MKITKRVLGGGRELAVAGTLGDSMCAGGRRADLRETPVRGPAARGSSVVVVEVEEQHGTAWLFVEVMDYGS